MALNYLTTFIESKEPKINYSNSDPETTSLILSMIKKSSLMYHSLFTSHNYSFGPFSLQDQLFLLPKLMLIINESSPNKKLFGFLGTIVIKLIKEKLFGDDYIDQILNFYLFSSNCFINFTESKEKINLNFFEEFIRIVIKAQYQKGFDLLFSSQSKLNLNASNSLYNSRYLIKLLEFGDNSIELISSIISWEYDCRILNLFIRELNKYFFAKKRSLLLSVIQKQLKLLLRVNQKEHRALANDPNKLMIGINVINGLQSETVFQFPKNDYVIEFVFKLNKEVNINKFQTILEFSNQSQNKLTFYIENSNLWFKFKKENKICEINVEKAYHICFKIQFSGLLKRGSIEVIIDHSRSVSFQKSEYLTGFICLFIDGFNGQIGKIMIYNQSLTQKENEDQFAFLFDPQVAFYQYHRKGKKEYRVIKFKKKFKLHQNTREFFIYSEDIPFRYCILKESFVNYEGFDYLLLIMNYFHMILMNDTNQEEPIDILEIYQCIQLLFQLVYELELYNKEKVTALFYSMLLLIPKVCLKYYYKSVSFSSTDPK